jgi:DNA (cytosine-5)-methyltransferase 1
LPHLRDGVQDRDDPLHRSSKLSPLNKRRIIATPKDGGSAKSWPQALIPACYKRRSGKTYMTTVYGRMRWDDPSPTMTTNCTTLGTGRFGHPSQNRAISLREAVILQSFPQTYDFGPFQSIDKFTKHLGNAVPVLLARAIAKSIKRHIKHTTAEVARPPHHS